MLIFIEDIHKSKLTLLEGFVIYLRTEKRYSEHTIKAYAGDLSQFFKYIDEAYNIKIPSEVKSQMIRSWVIELMDHNTSSRSVNRKLSTLKSYYKYLRREGLLKENPMLKVSVPKVKSRLPSYMEQEDMKALFSDKMFDINFVGVRNRLILMLLYYTGMRRGELIGLQLSSFDPFNRTLKVLGKGNKERIIPINKELISLIEEYLNIMKKEKIALKSDTLIVTDNGNQLYPNFVYRVVKDHLSKVSTAQKRSPHVLRHTFATHMLNNGADLNAIKEILGHANLSATQIYTHNSVEQLKQIYKQAHPKA